MLQISNISDLNRTSKQFNASLQQSDVLWVDHILEALLQKKHLIFYCTFLGSVNVSLSDRSTTLVRTAYLNNYWMDSNDICCRHLCPPKNEL